MNKYLAISAAALFLFAAPAASFAQSDNASDNAQGSSQSGGNECSAVGPGTQHDKF